MEFADLIKARRSIRAFVPREISDDEIEDIVSDALNAPSWKNTEVTRYHAAVSREAKDRLWCEALPSFNVASSADAAALVAVTFRRGESGYMGDVVADELGETWGVYDAGLASAYFVLAARDHGWDSLILGVRNAEKVKQLLGIPDDETLTAVIAIGKAARTVSKPPRKPVSQVLKVL